MADEQVNIEALLAHELARFDPSNRGTSAPLGGAVVNWRELDDEDARAVWEHLRSWVEWVTVRYDVPLSIVPNCWFLHPALVEELSALHTAHAAAFDESDAGLGPISWHERFAAATPRLARAYGGGCSNGHQATRPRSWTNVIDDQEWEAWAATAHAHGGDTAPDERRNR
ncbi:hypothetical protein [Microbacterium aurum]